jgi:hypothetical protein
MADDVHETGHGSSARRCVTRCSIRSSAACNRTSTAVRISAYDVERHFRRRYGQDGPPPALVDQWFREAGGSVISTGASFGSRIDEGPWPESDGRHAFELPRVTYDRVTEGRAPPTSSASA